MSEHLIPFNVPFLIGNEHEIFKEVLEKKKFSGGGYYTKKCEAFLKQQISCKEVLLTSSCTHALEMCALLIDIEPGDEVIMPSFIFVSAANAFVLRGAKIVFVDVEPETMNIDAQCIEAAITSKTKVILLMHYGGVVCKMDKIIALAKQYDLFLIEDAAHGMGASYNGQALGSFGDLATISFHETKNIHCGEGGALIINNPIFINRAHIIREKGTNRRAFELGDVDRYTWVDIGSSYLMGEISAAFLWNQLQHLAKVTIARQQIHNFYEEELQAFQELGQLSLCNLPSDNVEGNGHLFYVIFSASSVRTAFIHFMRKKKVHCNFHYVPLHSSIAGQEWGSFKGIDRFTTSHSLSLVRLPLYVGLTENELNYIVALIKTFMSDPKRLKVDE